MANSNNKQSNGFIFNALGVAKKFSNAGLELLDHVAPNSVAKLNSTQNQPTALDGQARKPSPFQSKHYENPEQMLREHLPQVTRQVLGRHFNKVNNVAHLVSPDLSDKVSAYFFEQINDFTNQISSVDSILDEVGAQELEELTQDISRSQRISNALAEQNKWIAVLQGAFSGATGVIGSAVDIPASMIIALRTIYQIGRAYGFDLEKPSDQDVVQYIFKQVDLSLIAEKQTVLLALKTLSSTLKTHDIQHLQQLVGSSNDLQSLKAALLTSDGQFKWTWLNHVPKVSVFERLGKLTPLAGAGVGAVYSWRLVDDVNSKAQHVFSTARHYLLNHAQEEIGLLAAYEKAAELLAQASPKLLAASNTASETVDTPIFDQDIAVEDNDNFSSVKLVQHKKSASDQAEDAADISSSDTLKEEASAAQQATATEPNTSDVQFDEKIHTGIADLKSQLVQTESAAEDTSSSSDVAEKPEQSVSKKPTAAKSTAKVVNKKTSQNVTKPASDPS